MVPWKWYLQPWTKISMKRPYSLHQTASTKRQLFFGPPLSFHRQIWIGYSTFKTITWCHAVNIDFTPSNKVIEINDILIRSQQCSPHLKWRISISQGHGEWRTHLSKALVGEMRCDPAVLPGNCWVFCHGNPRGICAASKYGVNMGH